MGGAGHVAGDGGRCLRIRRDLPAHVRPEPCVGPRQQVAHHVLLNCTLLQEHPQHLVSEEPRERLGVGCPRDGEEGAVAPKQAPRDQEMHVGMPIQEIAGALEARDSARNGCLGPRCGLEQLLERFVGQAGESGQSLPAAEEGPQAPREREDHVAVGNGFQDLFGDELAKGRLPLRMARGAETALLA